MASQLNANTETLNEGEIREKLNVDPSVREVVNFVREYRKHSVHRQVSVVPVITSGSNCESSDAVLR